MTQLGAEILGAYSLMIVVGLALYHTVRFAKTKDTVSQIIVTVLVPVMIFLANII